MDRDLYSGVGLWPMLGPGGLYPILQHPILGAAGRSNHSQLTVHSAGRVVGSTGKPPGVRERAAGLLAEPPERPGCRLHRHRNPLAPCLAVGV